MDNPKSPHISIIIPCYNSSLFLRKCLGALEAQTYRDFEVLFVDDCSKDDTYEKLSEYIALSRLNARVLRNDRNRGPAYSRNRAIDVAVGDWIAFCDADDWYESDFLEKMYLSAQQNDADLVMCEYRKVFESHKKNTEIHYLQNLSHDFSNEDAMAYSKSSLCLLLLKKTIVGDVRIPNLRNGEDIAVVPCLEMQATRITVVREPLYNYYIRGESVSNCISDTICNSLFRAFEFIETGFGSKYPVLLEFMGIKIVLYGAVLNAFKANTDISGIIGIVDGFTEKYPQWVCNRYFGTLPVFKRLFLHCVKHRFWRMAKAMARIHAKFSI